MDGQVVHQCISPGFLVDLQAQLVLVFLFDPVHQEVVKPQLQFAHEFAGTNVPGESKSVTCLYQEI